MTRAVFLDRDGVLIRPVVSDAKPYPARSVAEIVLVPGVEEGLGRLKDAGFLLIVVTNQPDVGRGTLSREPVEAIHAELMRRLPLDSIRVCYHGKDGECACRKPQPGMLLEAARDFAVDLSQSFLIGDRWRDVDAGQAAGCRTVFIDYGYAETLRAMPDFVVSPSRAWNSAVESILSASKSVAGVPGGALCDEFSGTPERENVNG